MNTDTPSRRTLPLGRRPVSLLLGAVLLAGCPPTEPVDTTDTDTSDTSDTAIQATPVITVSAATVFLGVGDTVALQAATSTGADTSYTWASTNEAVASVDAAGVVTARSHGEVAIVATGLETSATGEIGLYVSEQPPFLHEWLGSAHANSESEVFRHWDEDGAIPASCARCHSSAGFHDYLDDEVVDAAAPTGDVITCMTCHDPRASALSTVVFPSGVRVEGLGPEAICMTCHQGRASGDSVDAQIGGLDPVPGADEVSTGIRFTNIHYYAAGATLNAGVVRGGYQYTTLADGSRPLYDVRFRHVAGFDTCVGCHDPHTLQLRLPLCADCHDGVATVDDIKDIRMVSSATSDYDGDGDLSEGLYYELQGVKAKLLAAIQAYADQTTGAAAICYDGAAYPYFLQDTNGNGTCDATETDGYATFTPRLARAAYNYQVASKDPGAFAHNGKYIIELMHDSIRDLNHGLGTPIAFEGVRNDPGHFNGTGNAFRRWDASEALSASCSRCHGGAEGFHFYTTFGQSIPVLDKPNGLDCATCHDEAWFKGEAVSPLVTVASVTFPGGVTKSAASFAAPSDAICATCHSGRRSKRDVDATTNPGNSSVHYLPAAATWYGAELQVGYEYDGKRYDVGWNHANKEHSSCSFCHAAGESQHTFRVADVWDARCGAACHAGQTPEGVRNPSTVTLRDYDGDGDPAEPLVDELHVFQTQLLRAMDAFSQARSGPRLCFDTAFRAGLPDAEGRCVGTSPNFNGWTVELMRASHNFGLSKNDPAAWAHNMPYVTQLLYDSIQTLDPSQLQYTDDVGTFTLNRLTRLPPQ